MLARLLIFVYLCFALLMALLVWYFADEYLVEALIGVAGLSLLIVPLSLLGFLLAARVNRHDPAPRASGWRWLRAWWGELIQMGRVFAWRQPFRANAWPDEMADAFAHRGRRGVLLIHGFMCNRGFWSPWAAHLSHHKHAFAAVNLEPLFGSMDAYVPCIDAAIRQLTQATGLPPLVVCHSMGGLAIRAWLRADPAAASQVHHVVTIGTPHYGTWLAARFSLAVNGRQMRQHSRWLLQLEQDELARARDLAQAPYRLFTCFYSNCDNIVFPASTAMLPGAHNCLVPGLAHVALAFEPAVIAETMAKI